MPILPLVPFICGGVAVAQDKTKAGVLLPVGRIRGTMDTVTRLYSVTGSVATPAPPSTLAALGLQERAHLQEWLIANSEVLGDVLVVTSEFDKWSGADGVKAKDRLDILALESSGRLVACELKRDHSGPSVHLQAITYAALSSRFTEDTLIDAYHAFRTSRGEQLSRTDAADRLLEHVGGEFDPEMLRRPRIVLVAGSFPPQVTHTAVWLNEMGVSVTLLQSTLWQVGGSTLAGFTQLYPTPDLEEFTLSPTAVTSAAVSKKAQTLSKQANAVARIIASGLLADGAALTLQPSHGTNDAQRKQIAAWVAEKPERGQAVWRNDKAGPIVWAADGNGWRPTTLARHILMEATGAEAAIRGPAWWLTETGADLASLADGLPGTTGAKDWTDLHTVLAGIQAGQWTTYGDLADVIGTGAQALGQHITKCPTCPHAWRVLTAHGRPAPGFEWADPTDTRTQEQALIDEGVAFVNGAADPADRLTVTQLKNLLDPA